MLHYDSVPSSVAELLKALAGHAGLDGFALGGGTNLALRLGHRVSVDLDWFTLNEFKVGNLRSVLGGLGTEVAKAAGALTLDVEGTKMDLLRHAYPLVAPLEEIDCVAMLSLEDVAAMKLNAVANRGSKKDFYDLHELLNHRPLEAWVECFVTKYQASDPFTVIRSLTWFEDADSEPDPISLRKLSWSEVRSRITTAVREL
ncbi:nucleotidyl transferase AbiEii/AbiGii toxin family protein [Haloferula sp.]|uniref:nucleotidyl transferase AbiEii/AbiGii toxin family protein n=1 Tax=Haloferula sp. TaxID=2497595 RepID=UPI003C768506